MHLKRLRIRNIYQTAELDWALQPGLIAIVGAMGSGKTNILAAIRATLTGDFGQQERGVGIKDVVRHGVKPSDAWVEATWHLDDGQELLIRRYPASVSESYVTLQRPGQAEDVVKAGRTKTALEQVIVSAVGLSPDVISKYLFVAQERSTAMFGLQDTARADFYSRLFNLLRLAEIRKELQQQLAGDRAIVGEYDAAQEEQARVAYLAASGQHHEQKQQVAAQVALLMPDTKFEKLTARLYAAEMHRAAKLDYETAGRTLRRARQSEIECRENLERIAVEFTTVDTELAEQQARGQTAAVQGMIYTQWKQAVQQQTQRRELDLQLAAIESTLVELPPAPEEDATELRQRQRVLSQRLSLARGELEFCEVCGTQHQDLRPIDARPLLEELAVIEASLAALAAYRVAEAEDRAKRAEWNRLTDRRSGMSAVEPGPEPPKPIDATQLKAIQAKCDALTRRKRELQVARDSASRTQGSCQTVITQAVAQQQAAAAVREQYPDVTEDIFQRLVAAISLQESRRETLVQLRETAGRTCQRAVVAALQYRTHRRQLRRVLRLVRWIEDSEPVLEALRPVKLPADLATHYANVLADRINQVLPDLGVSWTVRFDETLDLRVLKGGVDEPIRSLSGGQKKVTAIAFWVAQIASLSSFLALDEPVDGLDAQARGNLSDALEHLAKLCERTGRQIIFVTHAPELAARATQTKALGDYVCT